MSNFKLRIGYVGVVKSVKSGLDTDSVIKDAVLFRGILRDVNLNHDKTLAYVIIDNVEGEDNLSIIGSSDIDLRKVEFIRSLDKIGVSIDVSKPIKMFVSSTGIDSDDNLYSMSIDDFN